MHQVPLPQVKPRMINVSWTVYNYHRPEDVGVIKYLSKTNVNDYRRKNGTGKSEDPKYHDTNDMNVYGNSCNDKHVPLPSPRSREPLLPPRNVNNYYRPQVTRIRQVLLQKCVPLPLRVSLPSSCTSTSTTAPMIADE